MRIRILPAVVLAAALAGCGQKKAERFEALPFPDAVPPGMMSEPSDIAEYLSLHYWDALTDTSRTYPCDSQLVSGVRKAEVERNFARWTDILDAAGQNVAEKSVAKLFARALACERKDTSSNVLETLFSLSQTYFFDANSPFRNEDLYGIAAAKTASCATVEPVMRDKLLNDARLCSLNRIGTQAADFRFADRNGRMRTLYGIQAPLTLLFFSNPGCEACMNIINVLKGEGRIAELISSGRLAVLNIYIDEDLAAWRSYMPVYPPEWYNGFDPDFVIRNETLYNVRAIPSLYLLDSQKRVILKDAPEQKLFQYLENYTI